MCAEHFELEVIVACPADVGYSACRRDREFVVGVRRGLGRFTGSLQAAFDRTAASLSQSQVPQDCTCVSRHAACKNRQV